MRLNPCFQCGIGSLDHCRSAVMCAHPESNSSSCFVGSWSYFAGQWKGAQGPYDRLNGQSSWCSPQLCKRLALIHCAAVGLGQLGHLQAHQLCKTLRSCHEASCTGMLHRSPHCVQQASPRHNSGPGRSRTAFSDTAFRRSLSAAGCSCENCQGMPHLMSNKSINGDALLGVLKACVLGLQVKQLSGSCHETLDQQGAVIASALVVVLAYMTSRSRTTLSTARRGHARHGMPRSEQCGLGLLG